MKNKKTAAVTLIELIIAITILIIIIVPLASMFITSTRTNVWARDITIASLTAQLFVEENIGLTDENIFERFSYWAYAVEIDGNTYNALQETYYEEFTDAEGNPYSVPHPLNGAIQLSYWNGFHVTAVYTPQPNQRWLIELRVYVRHEEGGNVLASHTVILNTGPGGGL